MTCSNCVELLEALENLRDLQNGPPLYKYEGEWNQAMEMADAAIAKGEEDDRIAASEDLLEALEVAEHWMSWWVDLWECDCESYHTCGIVARRRELAMIQATIAKAKGEGDDG